MIKCWSDEAWEDFEYWTKQDFRSSQKTFVSICDLCWKKKTSQKESV